MSTYEYAYCVFRAQLAGLPHRRSYVRFTGMLYLLCEPAYTKVAWFLAEKPGIRGELWKMLHASQWQKSSGTSAAMWILATPVVYVLVGRLGYGWEINAAVSVVFDGLGFIIHKYRIFDERKVAPGTSYSRNVAVWMFFFLINVLLAYLVFHRLGGGTLFRRSVLGVYGLAMNPVMFKLRDRVIFTEDNLGEIAAARFRFDANRAMALSQFILHRIRA